MAKGEATVAAIARELEQANHALGAMQRERDGLHEELVKARNSSDAAKVEEYRKRHQVSPPSRHRMC
jgi:uncharacterized membrane protein